MAASVARAWLPRVALLLIVLPAGVNALTGPYLALSAPESSALPATTPERLRISMAVEERLVGVLLTGFSLLAVAVAWIHHRRPSRASLAGIFAVAATFAAVTAVMALAGGGLTMYYGVQTVLVVIGAGLAATRGIGDASDGAPMSA